MSTTQDQLPKLQQRILDLFANAEVYTNFGKQRRLTKRAEPWHIVGQAVCSNCLLDGNSYLADVRNDLQVQCYICLSKSKPIFCKVKRTRNIPFATRRLLKLFIRETETSFQSSPGTYGRLTSPALALTGLDASVDRGKITFKDTVQQGITTGSTATVSGFGVDFWPTYRWEPVSLKAEISYSFHKERPEIEGQSPVRSDGFYKTILSPHYLFEGISLQLSELEFQLTEINKVNRGSSTEKTATYTREYELSEPTAFGERFVKETVFLLARAATL